MASGFLLGDFYLRRQHPPKLQNLQKELSRMLWDATTGAALHTLNSHSSDVTSVAFSPDGKLVHTLFVLNDWIVEGGTIFSGFLLIIERLV
jgi:WD40 repeat protein